MKRYVIPWLEGPKVQERKLDDIHASVQELQNSVTTTGTCYVMWPTATGTCCVTWSTTTGTCCVMWPTI